MSENIGTWEKHTKGIGSKLLQKFGFKGRLGLNEDGISSAIEVTVRPVNLGLGFDSKNDKKSTNHQDVNEKKRKKSNIEPISETRLKRAKSHGNDFRSGVFMETKESILKRLLTANLDHGQNIDNGNEYVAGQIIIDMRSKETKYLKNFETIAETNDESRNTKIEKFCFELIANLESIDNFLEIQLKKDLTRLKDENLMKERLTGDIETLVASKQLLESRQHRVKTFHELFKHVHDCYEVLLNNEDLSNQSKQKELVNNAWDTICKIFSDFEDLFYEFKCDAFLVKLLSASLPRFKSISAENDMSGIREQLNTIVLKLAAVNSLLEDKFKFRAREELQSILQRQIASVVGEEILPSLRRIILNPLVKFCPHSEDEIELIDVLCFVLQQLRLSLPESTMVEQLISTVIMPKVQSSFTATSQKPLAQWLFPLFDAIEAKHFAEIFPTVRRQISEFFARQWDLSKPEHLHSTDFLATTLHGWKRVFDANSFESLVARAVIPSMVKQLREHVKHHVNPKQQAPIVVSVMRAVLHFEAQEVITSKECALLFSTEVFPTFVCTLVDWLEVCEQKAYSDRSQCLKEIAEWYQAWWADKPTGNDILRNARLLDFSSTLRREKLFLRNLNIMLEIMRESYHHFSQGDHDIVPRSSLRKKYLALLNRLGTEDYFEISRLQRSAMNNEQERRRTTELSSNNINISLKDLLQRICEENNLKFLPRSKSIDGKQYFYFSDQYIVYLEEGIIYYASNTEKSTHFQPITAEDLLRLATNK